MELTLAQLAIIGLVATAVGAGLRLLVAKFASVEIGKGWMSIIAYVLSVGLAVVFLWPIEVSVAGDPSQVVAALLALATSVFGFATLIYNVLLDKVLDKFNLQVEELAKG